jgi:TolB-like protein
MSEHDRSITARVPMIKADQTAILCADIVDSSLLIAADEVFGVETVVYCRDTIAALAEIHDGHVFNMAGDGFMLCFEQPDRAVDFSLDLQSKLRTRNEHLQEDRQAWMRIGIAYGGYVKNDDQIYGDTVNVAARLQEACSPGAVVFTDQILERLQTPIEQPLSALGDLLLKNISHDVRAFEIVTKRPSTNPLDFAPVALSDHRDEPFADRSAIAVLPFEVNSSEPELSYLADGMCEDLITSLSHVRHFPVISKASSFAVAAKENEPRRIADLLGVRYLISGSLRGGEQNIRQTIQLIDASTNRILWNEKYTLKTPELLDRLDDQIAQIVGTLTTRLEGAEAIKARGKRRSQASVHDLVWRARWHFNRLGGDDAAEGKRLLDEALAIEPDNAEALIQRAFWHHLDAWKAQKSRDIIANNLRLAHRAIAADEFDSRGHLAAALAEILLRNFGRALTHCERAIELNPSYAHAYAEVGTCKLYTGKPEEALAPFETSLRFNPQDYYVFNILAQVAQTHCQLGNWDESLKYARRSSSLKPNFWLAHLCEVTSLVRGGELRAAAHACATLMKTSPTFSRQTIAWLPFKTDTEIEYFYESFEAARLEAQNAGLIGEIRPNSTGSNVTRITSR